MESLQFKRFGHLEMTFRSKPLKFRSCKVRAGAWAARDPLSEAAAWLCEVAERLGNEREAEAQRGKAQKALEDVLDLCGDVRLEQGWKGQEGIMQLLNESPSFGI